MKASIAVTHIKNALAVLDGLGEDMRIEDLDDFVQLVRTCVQDTTTDNK